MKIRSIYLSTIFLLFCNCLHAQAADDFLRSTGKIYAVVVGIIVIFLFIVLYLVRLERKVARLENENNNE